MKRGVVVACKVANGMFSTERSIKVELPDGKSVSALVDKDNVIVDRDPSPREIIEGKVKVSIVSIEKDTVWIDLPGAGLTNGTRVRVPRAFIENDSK